MATQKKIIGRLPVSRQEYAEGTAYYRDNIVTYGGSAFQCTADGATTAPAVFDDTGNMTVNAGWKVFADASAARIAEKKVSALDTKIDAEAERIDAKVDDMARDFGQYAELPSVAMTAETAGKYISSAGEFVDAEAWSIAAVGAVVSGNTYELYMGSPEKMVQGVALFVARITEQLSGGATRTTYTPLFSAVSADIPASGYVCFEAMQSYDDVLVCYRNDVAGAATLLVRRYGTKASIATQIGNLRREVDLKSFADGYYAGMRVGTADNLTARGDATEETFTRRTAGGDNAIEDGNATIKAIKGNSVVLNNSVDMTTGIATFGDMVAQADGSIIYTVTTKGDTDQYSNNNRITFKETKYSANDKVLILCKALAPYDSTQRAFVSGYSDTAKTSFPSVYYDTTAGEWSQCAGISTIPKDEDYDFRVGFPVLDITAVGDKFQVKEVQGINLTQMFGSGNEPATPEDFAARLGYASVADIPYIPYNEGTIVDMTATGIRTAGTDDDGLAWTQERSWKPVLDKYFGGHLRSAGNVRDEITANKAVKRIAHVEDLGVYNWGSNSGLWPTNSIYNFAIAKDFDLRPGYVIMLSIKATNMKIQTTSYGNALSFIGNHIYESADDAKRALTGVSLIYEMGTPEEYDIDEQNLTVKVSPGGTEEIITPEGGDVIASAPVVADIVYPIDSYRTIKDNKAHIGSVSSLATAAKSDLVAAINELTGRVAALENKAAETTAETSTEKEN